jgi:hypothetical protein
MSREAKHERNGATRRSGSEWSEPKRAAGPPSRRRRFGASAVALAEAEGNRRVSAGCERQK